jgi:hypothetical protein
MDFLSDVERRLDLPPAERSQVMRELKSHYREAVEELIKTDMSRTAATDEAVRRLGDPVEVACQLRAVHSRASLGSALLTMLPFVFMGLDIYRWPLSHVVPMILLSVVLSAMGVLLIAGAVRELVRDKRPIWLATWLMGAAAAAGFFSAQLHPPVAKTITDSVLLILAMALIWRDSRAQRTMVLCACLLVAGSILRGTLISQHRHVGAEILLLTWTMVLLGVLFLYVAIVVKTFSWHRYGDAGQAALFCFSYFVVIPTYNGLPSSSDVRSCIIGGVTAMLCALMPNWRLRVWIIMLGLTSKLALDSVEHFSLRQETTGVPDLLLRVVLFTVFVIGLPLLYREIRYGGRLRYS